MKSREQRVAKGSFLALLLAASALLAGKPVHAPAVQRDVFTRPSITLSRKAGPPTTKILISGSGFEPKLGVDLFFDTTDEALVTTDSDGDFHNIAIHAPRSALPGEHWVTALARNDHNSAQSPFLVQTNWPQFHFAASRCGFNPYENVLNVETVRNLVPLWSYEDDSVNFPAVFNGVVYAGALYGNGFLFAFNGETGAIIWRYQFSSSVLLSAPAISEDLVYEGNIAAFGDSFYALDAKNSDVVWTSPASGQIFSSPALANDTVYIASNGFCGGSQCSELFAYDAENGGVIWSKEFPSFANSGSPAVGKGRVYELPANEVLYALDAKTGAVLWTYESGDQSGLYSNPAVSNGLVYVGIGNTFYALNAGTGAVRWTYPSAGTDPAVADGVVYFGSGDFLYALNATTGKLLWKFPASKVASPSVANGVVYAGSQNFVIYALNARTGALLWSHVTPYSASGSPAIADGRVFAGTGTLYVFGLGGGTSEEENSYSSRPEPKTLHPDLKPLPSHPDVSQLGRP